LLLDVFLFQDARSDIHCPRDFGLIRTVSGQAKLFVGAGADNQRCQFTSDDQLHCPLRDFALGNEAWCSPQTKVELIAACWAIGGAGNLRELIALARP
jgi:hypothetical protein